MGGSLSGRGRARAAGSLLGAAIDPHRTSEQRVQAIAALRRLRFTGPEIAECLGMALSTVSGILTRIGMGKLGRLGLEPAQRYERDTAGRADPHRRQEARADRDRGAGHRITGQAAAQADISATPPARTGARRGWEYVHIAIDDCTRLAYAEVLGDEKATTVVGFLKRAVAFYARHGITVEQLLTDNGAGYRSTIHAIACRLWASAIYAPAPTDPKQTAKPNASSAPSSAAGPTARSTAPTTERAAALDGWLWHYNHQRRHSALGHQPPITSTCDQPPRDLQLVRVEDSGKIPSGIPTPHLPQLSLLSSLDLIAGAAAVAVIVLVQGTGVAEAAPNPGGSRSDPNRDFIAQGVGNIASGLFRGQPVGGSVGQTALNVAAGGRTRWASIFSGIWMLLIIVLFSGVVGEIPIPTLAAVLIFAAASSLRVARIDTVLRTGLPSQVAFFATFTATLFLSVTAAVGLGVLLSLLLQVNQEAVDLTVVRLSRDEDHGLIESPAPATLPSREVTLLDVYGSLLFAGARTLETLLPDPADSELALVVVRLRGRTTLGATAFIVLADYAERLRSAGGHMYLSGVTVALAEQLRDTHRVDLEDAVTVIPATETILESTQTAIDAAEVWLASHAG